MKKQRSKRERPYYKNTEKRHENQRYILPERKRIFVDTSFVTKEFNFCMEHVVVIPKFCLTELETIVKIKGDDYLVAKEFLEKGINTAEILYSEFLPYIPNMTPNLKKRSISFVRYAMLARRKYPGIRIFSNSTEVNELLSKNQMNSF